MKLYMVLHRSKDGTIDYRVGGGSSTPAIPRVYDSLPRAEQYIRNRDEGWFIIEIDPLECKRV